MGWVVISERELNRVEVLAQVDAGQVYSSCALKALPYPAASLIRIINT